MAIDVLPEMSIGACIGCATRNWSRAFGHARGRWRRARGHPLVVCADRRALPHPPVALAVFRVLKANMLCPTARVTGHSKAIGVCTESNTSRMRRVQQCSGTAQAVIEGHLCPQCGMGAGSMAVQAHVVLRSANPRIVGDFMVVPHSDERCCRGEGLHTVRRTHHQHSEWSSTARGQGNAVHAHG